MTDKTPERLDPSKMLRWADEIDNRLSPIPGRVADQLAVILRQAAAALQADQQTIERLRAALEKIAGGFINTDFVTLNPPDWHNAFEQLQKIAEAALEAAPEATHDR
jgi:hypothetical protein